MAVTLADIADKTGVSVSTVSRVLNGKTQKYRISKDTQQLVRQAADELDYRPNYLARNLRLSETHTVGLLAPDVSNPFFAAIIKRVQQAIYKLGYSLVVCNTDEDLQLEREHVNLLYRDRVDGIIAMPVGQSYEHLAEVQQHNVPLVLLDRCFEAFPAHSVVVDNYAGAFQATQHLLERGHERIALIQGLPGTFTARERLRGYRDALAAHDIEPDDRLVVGGDFREENGYVETKLLLNRVDPPTALFATSDLITLGVLQVLEEEGLSLPGDLSLISFDDFAFAPYLRCPLTVVRQPKETMAEMAVKLLMQAMHATNDDGTPDRILLRPELVVRASVGPPRA